MIKLIIITIAALAMNITAQAQDYKKGIALMQYQRYNSAAENFSALLQQKPDDGAAVYWLSEAFIKNKEPEKAEAMLNKQSATLKAQDIAQVTAARIMIAKDKKAEAGVILGRKMFTDTAAVKDLMLAIALGRTYTADGKFNLAESFLLRAHSLQPFDPYVPVLLGQNGYAKADGNATFKYFTQALNVQADYPAANFGLGRLFKAQKNPETYLPYFNKAVATDSLFAPAWYELYRYAYYNDKAKTNYFYNKYLETADKTEKQEFQLLVVDYNNKKYEKVIATGVAMLADNEANPPVELYKYLAYSYYVKKNNAAAYSNMLQYMDVQDSAKVKDFDRYLLAQFAARVVQKDSVAIKIIGKEYDRDTTSKNRYYYVVKLYNHYVDAKDPYNINVWKQALLPFKNYSRADMYKVGANWYDLNEFQKADAVFTDFVSRYPSAYEGIYMQGAVKAKLDSNNTEGAAIPYFTAFLDSTANNRTAEYKTQKAQAYAYLGSYYLSQKDYANALNNYQKLSVERPADADVKRTVFQIKKYLKDVKVYQEKNKGAEK